MSELQTEVLAATELSTTNHFGFVSQSQNSWRRLKRGIISRPQEIPSLSNALDTSIKKVFSTYINVNRPPTVVAWSVLRDEPLEPKGCQFDKRRPDGITEQDEEAYFTGIRQLNEWSTDFAAQYWLSHSPKHSLFQRIGKIYADISINSGQKIAYKQAYGLMEQVQLYAKKSGQNFEDAVFKALFQHDFSPVNMIISQSGIAECKTLDELALYLGKSLPKNNSTNILRSLYAQENESELIKLSKRTILSMLTGGWQSQPGIVEIVVAQPAAMFTAGAVGGATAIDVLTGIAAGTLGGVISGTLWGYALIHETVHDYQTDKNFNGFIPLTLVSIGKRPVNQ